MHHHHHHIAMDNSELFQFLAAGTNKGDSFFSSAAAAPYSSVTSEDATAAVSSMMMMQHSFSSSSGYYPLELSEITDNNINNNNNVASQRDRALAAMRNHKEAEKRRRERINSHLARLRTLLPCNSKTDKASLLAKVVQRVKELKQQTSEITDLETVPSETDEISVLSSGGDYSSGGEGRLILKASLCCEDRSDLIPELIEILNSLHLKTVRAEMATLGGRTRNVLVVAAEKEHSIESIHFLQNSLKSLIERSSNSSDRSKRRRGLDRRFNA